MNSSKALSMVGAALICAVVIGATASPVGAATPRPLTVVGHPHDFATRYVPYGDLDLASATGQQALKGRVGAAVNDACMEAVTSADLPGRFDCGSDAWSNAAPQIARAVRRAQDIAARGSSSLAEATIAVELG